MNDSGGLAALGLSSDPFAPDALPDFYFVGGQRRFLLQQAQHGIYIAGSIVLLCGERGAGKSHLLAALQRELEGLVDNCPIAASVLMDGVAIRRAVAECCGLPLESADDNESLVAALERQVPVAAEPLPVALLIDDAHELAVATLAELQRLVEMGRGRIRLLLAGEPTLVAAWQQLPVAAAELLELQPLDLQESADYLQTRLQAAGYRGVLPLTAVQLQKLHRDSGGCPGRLNALATSVLVAPRERAEVGSAMRMRLPRQLPWRTIGIAAAVLLLAAGVLLVDRGEEEREALSPERTSVPLALPTASSPAADTVEGERAVVDRVVPADRVEPPAPSVQSERERAALQASAPSKSVVEAPVAKAPVAVGPVAEPSAAVPPVASRPVAPPPPPQVSEPRPAPPRYRFDESRLLALAPEQALLQLMASSSDTKLREFARTQAAGVTTLIFEARRNGKPWFVLVAGPYADMAAARTAAARLPSLLQQQKPWPRSVASVQADIRAAHQR
jgi:DamX protein